MNEYCIFAQYCYYEYTWLRASACLAPARDSPLISNESTFPQTTGKAFSNPPIASINPSKTDAAQFAAASPPGNPRGSDGPTGDACESTSGTRGFRTASKYEATFDTHMLGEIYGPRTLEGDLRGHDRSRLLDGTTAGAPGGALGRVTVSFGNPRETDGSSERGALAKRSDFEEPGFPSTRFFFSRAETRPVSTETRHEFFPSIFSPCCTHQAITLFRKTQCQPPWSLTPLISPRSPYRSRTFPPLFTPWIWSVPPLKA